MSTVLQQFGGISIDKVNPNTVYKGQKLLGKYGLSLEDFVEFSLNQLINNPLLEFELKLLKENNLKDYKEISTIEEFDKLVENEA